VLVWINGPFGGGKTVTAHELARRCEGAVVCDPEEVGFGLRRAMPREAWTEDFQDLRPGSAEPVHTDGCTVAQVADAVADLVGLRIAPSNDGPVRGWLRRTRTSLRHIRIR
jgi:vacuolar-type H+-ATPase catalytic subunit A/Vma1